MKKTSLFFCLMLIGLLAFKLPDESLFKIPENWPKPYYDFNKNPLTKEKIFLGRTLFYDPILSADNSVSCSSCHSPFTAFTHTDHTLSHGIDDRIGTRNSPALMNLAWQKSFMWDGAIHHLDAQALAPISHPDEMGSNIADVVNRLQKKNRYKKLFAQAYGDSLVTGERTLKAISQFMLTLVSSNSKYDKVQRKEPGFSFTEAEEKGYELFKSNCAVCHAEPLFTNNDFENNGLEPDTNLNDIGRKKISQKESDLYKFKVPSLRNIEFSYPYMHDGRYQNLEMALFHYSNNIFDSKTLSKHLKKKIQFSSEDKSNIISFLKTLSDESFLRNSQNGFPR
jgi:cytochrome c peroxidase